jgi:nucleoside-diphosphate-sugar epimerase
MTAIVITGSRGYIGDALTRRLAGNGRMLRLVSRAWGMARLDPDKDKNYAVDFERVSADLRDERAWGGLLDGVDAIVHLSSRTDLRAAEANPEEDAHLNIDPVRALVRAAERSGSRPLVVFASAVTIVGARHSNPVDENTPDNPCSVYDRHKLACETVLRDAARRGTLRACSLRLANVYGFGGDSVNSNRGILNAMMKRASAGKPLTLYGDGTYVRDFIHLADVVEAIAAAVGMERGCEGEHYVIATGQGHSLAEAFHLVADEVFRLAGRRVEIRHVPQPPDLHPIERRSFVGDSRLFSSLTGWSPQVELATGIRDYLVSISALPARIAVT